MTIPDLRAAALEVSDENLLPFAGELAAAAEIVRLRVSGAAPRREASEVEMTAVEVARLLNITRVKSVYELTRRFPDPLPCNRYSEKRIRFTPSAVRAWQERQGARG